MLPCGSWELTALLLHQNKRPSPSVIVKIGVGNDCWEKICSCTKKIVLFFFLWKYCVVIFTEGNLLEMLQTTFVSLPRLLVGVGIIIQKLLFHWLLRTTRMQEMRHWHYTLHYSLLITDYLGQQECKNGNIGIDIITCTFAPAVLRILAHCVNVIPCLLTTFYVRLWRLW